MKDPNKALVLNKNKSIQSNIHHAHHWKEKQKTWIRLGETSIRSQLFWLNSKKTYVVTMWLHATLEYIRIHGTGIVTYCYLQLVSFSWHVLLLFVVYVDKDSFRETYRMIITLLTDNSLSIPGCEEGPIFQKKMKCSNNMSRAVVNPGKNWEHRLVNQGFQKSLSWKTTLLLGWTIFRGYVNVGFREGIPTLEVSIAWKSGYTWYFCMIWGQHVPVNQRSLYLLCQTKQMHYVSGKTHTHTKLKCMLSFFSSLCSTGNFNDPWHILLHNRVIVLSWPSSGIGKKIWVPFPKHPNNWCSVYIWTPEKYAYKNHPAYLKRYGHLGLFMTPQLLMEDIRPISSINSYLVASTHFNPFRI